MYIAKLAKCDMQLSTTRKSSSPYVRFLLHLRDEFGFTNTSKYRLNIEIRFFCHLSILSNNHGFFNTSFIFQNLNHCKLNGDYNRTFYCTIDFTSSAGIYRQTYKYIFIRLMARNVLGNKTENFIINHFQIGKFHGSPNC